VPNVRSTSVVELGRGSDEDEDEEEDDDDDDDDDEVALSPGASDGK
jgi:hypothetical protein